MAFDMYRLADMLCNRPHPCQNCGLVCSGPGLYVSSACVTIGHLQHAAVGNRKRCRAIRSNLADAANLLSRAESQSKLVCHR